MLPSRRRRHDAAREEESKRQQLMPQNIVLMFPIPKSIPGNLGKIQARSEYKITIMKSTGGQAQRNAAPDDPVPWLPHAPGPCSE
ncbi:hypothetical protein scyTo_0001513 [Scyliorhinus torazame]|uniref:Uncharacterized protein n=1 Tax=Scyliorhinus torazame TaxID=75743 RepID=A0A401PDT5_SCYTO|nr:hypothetical protein [Scyliorhinus torazame]